MAELVGLTASVIGIAELATKIVAASFKVKGLLEQVSNVPDELQRHLDQIQLFSHSFLASHINEDGPPALRDALGVAIIQCQQAADDLGKLASDLHAQIHEGSRARRKIQAARVVLQKDALASHEKRLSSAMQMLMMACQIYGLEQQRYLIWRDLQRRQPDVIVAQILGSLQTTEVATPMSSQPHCEPVRQYADPATSQNCVTERRGVLWAQRFRPYLKLGLTGLTGSLEVQYDSRGVPEESDEDFSDLRIRIHLPRWFSSKSLDSILRKKTMMNVALCSGNWQICDFLAGYDVPVTAYVIPSRPPWYEQDCQSKCFLNVASHYSHDTSFACALIQYYNGPIARFDAIRRSIWPDCEFYDASVLHERLWLASHFTEFSAVIHMGSNSFWNPLVPSQARVVRALLSQNGKIFLAGIGPLLLGYQTYGFTRRRLQELLVSLSTMSRHMTTKDASGLMLGHN
ncbi:hypothetical protein PG994_008506 [Apiospora phragmitis]|uniref:Fungal N-terminal domain-containing protein n=1 Tax=Apiospora phragmitis TaxID=2905665 RepID=A0ABR1UGN6_9PEZI